MKRAMAVAILLLMVLTSLNAGTLAIYTSRVDLAPVTIIAKRFALGVNQGSAGEFDLHIAPGDMVSYTFSVSNTDSEGRTGEVDMDLHVEADFSGVYQALPGIRVTLVNDGVTVAQSDAQGRLSYSRSRAFLASAAHEATYSLAFEWPDSEAARAVGMTQRHNLPLSIYVRGVQHV